MRLRWATKWLFIAGAVFASLSFAKAASAYDVIQVFGGNVIYTTQQYQLCLTVEGTSGLQVYSDVCESTTSNGNQRLNWDGEYVTYVSGGTTYYMTNHGSTVTMDTWSNSTRQQWTLEGSNLINSYDNSCLDVTGNTTNYPTHMDTYTCNGQLNQANWVPGPEFQLYNDQWGKCLYEQDSGFDEYQMASCNASDTHQLFVFNGNGIQNVHSGLCVHWDTSWNALMSETCDGTDYDNWDTAQWWPSGGSHLFASFNPWFNNDCLDVNSSGIVVLNSCNSGSTSQYWQLYEL